MFTHILVPLDGSPFSEQALPAAIKLALCTRSKITLLQVLQPPQILVHEGGMSYVGLSDELRKLARDEAQAYLRSHQAWIIQEGCVVDFITIDNNRTAEAVLDFVEQSDVDTIVMSTHGRGGIQRWVYGSVADKVLRHATVPVLLIRANDTVSSELTVTAKVRKSTMKPEEDSAETLDWKIKEEQEPTAAERLIDEYMIDRMHK